MQESDQERFFSLWEIVTEDVKNPPSEEKLLLYWRALEPYNIEQIERAMMAHIRDPERGQYVPKPSDLVRHIEGDPEARADHAWGRVIDTVRRYGGCDDVVFDDPCIHAVIRDMGGWRSLCGMQISEEPFRAMEFRRIYQGVCRELEPKYPAILEGIHLDFGKQTRYIGNPGVCQRTIEGGYGAEDRPKPPRDPGVRRNFKLISGTIEAEAEKLKKAGGEG